jgi:hypothetical protein
MNYPRRSSLLRAECVSLLLILMTSPGLARQNGIAKDGSAQPLVRRLQGAVKDFDNGGQPLIQTLLRVAAKYDLPMGIEQVTGESVRRPIRVALEHGTVRSLLDLCVKQLPGYAWGIDTGVVNVFGQGERADASNLFNLVVPSFRVENQTIDTASERLEMTIVFQVEKPRGIAGSHLGNAELERRRITLAVRTATVREILNRMVALDGRTVWLARVPPSELSRIPEGGLWVIIPHRVQDPTGLLDVTLRNGR